MRTRGPWYHPAWQLAARTDARAAHSCRHGAQPCICTARRSIPCPEITGGCRRRLQATRSARRSSRVATRRTPSAEPEGGFCTTSGAGLAPLPGSLCSCDTYWSLATTLFSLRKVYTIGRALVKALAGTPPNRSIPTRISSRLSSQVACEFPIAHASYSVAGGESRPATVT
jgi:hypothetical protein